MTSPLSLLCIAFAVSIAIGQIFFKIAADGLQGLSGNFALNAILRPTTWLAFGWYGSTSFLWLFVLMRVPLSKAYPFALLGSALVPLFSWLIFRERLSLSYVLGALLVLAGLYVIFTSPFTGRGA